MLFILYLLLLCLEGSLSIERYWWENLDGVSDTYGVQCGHVGWPPCPDENDKTAIPKSNLLPAQNNQPPITAVLKPQRPKTIPTKQKPIPSVSQNAQNNGDPQNHPDGQVVFQRLPVGQPSNSRFFPHSAVSSASEKGIPNTIGPIPVPVNNNQGKNSPRPAVDPNRSKSQNIQPEKPYWWLNKELPFGPDITAEKQYNNQQFPNPSENSILERVPSPVDNTKFGFKPVQRRTYLRTPLKSWGNYNGDPAQLIRKIYAIHTKPHFKAT